MPGAPHAVLQLGRQTAGPQPATILLFSTNIPSNGGQFGLNTAPFALTEKGIYQVDVDPIDLNNPGTVLFQSSSTAAGTFTTEITMPMSGTVNSPIYYDLPQSKVGWYFRFNTTAGAKGLKVSMYDPFPDQ